HSTYYCSTFFFTAPAPTEIYTLSLHDALPISSSRCARYSSSGLVCSTEKCFLVMPATKRLRSDRLLEAGSNSSGIYTSAPQCLKDRKSTRLNSSHRTISYAVFCLKKKKKNKIK